METNNRNVEIIEALDAFGNAVSNCRADNLVLPWSPMLPYVYGKYGKQSPRMFYVGRDTYGWDLAKEGGFSAFFEKYDAKDLGGYIDENANALTLEKRIEAWAGSVYSFWHVINQLHLKIRFGNTGNLLELSAKEKDALDEIGYGNLNSIELPATLEKQECWGDIDQEKYWVIKQASERCLDKYRFILNAFSPDCTIITSWSGNESAYFEGLEYEELPAPDCGVLKVKIYRVRSADKLSTVIWTYHPSYLPRISVSWQEFVDKIASVVRSNCNHM